MLSSEETIEQIIFKKTNKKQNKKPQNSSVGVLNYIPSLLSFFVGGEWLQGLTELLKLGSKLVILLFQPPKQLGSQACDTTPTPLWPFLVSYCKSNMDQKLTIKALIFPEPSLPLWCNTAGRTEIIIPFLEEQEDWWSKKLYNHTRK